MIKKLIKKLLGRLLGVLPLDAVLWGSQRVSTALARLIFLRDWRVQADGRPQFFRHQIDFACWTTDPSRWAFTARGVFVRESMFKGCKVLDLCCGDGFYSYFFFSDIAGKVDAVDGDAAAISYAKRYHAAPVIEYHKINIVDQPLPAGQYDVVVWNAAICYFTDLQIVSILKEIVRVGKEEVILCGMAPKASGYPDHKTEFSESHSLKEFLERHFKFVTIREVNEMATVFYFRAHGAFAPKIEIH